MKWSFDELWFEKFTGLLSDRLLDELAGQSAFTSHKTFCFDARPAIRGDGNFDNLAQLVPIVPVAFDCKASGRNGFGVSGISPTLRSMNHAGSHHNGRGQLAVAIVQNCRDELREIPISPTLSKGGGNHYVPSLSVADDGIAPIRQQDLPAGDLRREQPSFAEHRRWQLQSFTSRLNRNGISNLGFD